MKKIKLITSFYDPYILGGAELSNKLLAEGFKDKIDVITLGEENKEEIINNVSIKRINFNRLITFIFQEIETKKSSKILKFKKLLYKLECYFCTFKYEKIVEENLKNSKIIHTSGINYFFPHIWWKIAKKNKKMTVHTLRDPILIYSKLNKRNNIFINIFDFFHKKNYIKYVDKYVDYIHSPTQYMIDLHINNGFKFKNTKVIPNTVNIDFKDVKFQSKVYDLIFVGTLEENKGIRTLIKLKENNPNLNMVLVGDGSFSKKAKKSGIKVTGWLKQDEVFKWIEKSKVLVLPSEWEEAFGRVLIESIALGTISIGSDRGGIPEVLFNDLRYIFESKNVTALNQKIERILALNENQYVEELRKLQEKMSIYKYENHIRQFEEFYEQVLKNRG